MEQLEQYFLIALAYRSFNHGARSLFILQPTHYYYYNNGSLTSSKEAHYI